jgi:[pyruvate, phosphate dikinase]-phosphate phosphotransferase / [pyruvate, phosphate dikinase] kinase
MGGRWIGELPRIALVSMDYRGSIQYPVAYVLLYAPNIPPIPPPSPPHRKTIAGIVKGAKKKNALVVYTLSDSDLRQRTSRMCELSGLDSVDLMGPLLDELSAFFGEAPMGTPGDELSKRSDGAGFKLTDSYYRRIEAVEFTLKADDGSAPWLLADADVVLCGVSRTGKTPLSVVLAQQMGLKVANVPLVMEVKPPKELFEDKLDSRKVFCLTINPTELKRIRTNRLERANVKSYEEAAGVGGGIGGFSGGVVNVGKESSNYADRAYVLKDLMSARSLAREYGWTEIDVTGRAVEETASYISQILSHRKDDVEVGD